MGNVLISSSQKPSKPNDEATTPPRPSLPVYYSPNHTNTNIPNQTLPPLRKKSSLLDSDAESYRNPQGVGTPIQRNLQDPHVDYTDNLNDNNFLHNFVNYAQQVEEDNDFWENYQENVRNNWKPKKITNRQLEDALRQAIQISQKYSHKIKFQKTNIPDEDFEDPNDICDEDEIEKFVQQLVKLLNGINRKGGLKTFRYKKVVMMLINEHNDKLNDEIAIKEGKVCKPVENYLSACKDYTPKSIRIGKAYFKDKLIELMSDESVVNVVLNEVKYKKNEIEELIFLEKYIRYFKEQLGSGKIDYRTKPSDVLDQDSIIEQKNLQKGRTYSVLDNHPEQMISQDQNGESLVAVNSRLR